MPENRAQRRMREAGERRQVFVPRQQVVWFDSSSTTSTDTTSIYWNGANWGSTNAVWTTNGGAWALGSYQAYMREQYGPDWLAPVIDPEAQERLRVQGEVDLARYTARAEAFRIERERAIDRAELLLQESLSPQQLAMLRDRGFFEVATIDQYGRPRLFRLGRGRVANILEINVQQEPIRRFCVHPAIDCPDADTLLAQKLWLENQPDELLAMANRHPI